MKKILSQLTFVLCLCGILLTGCVNDPTPITVSTTKFAPVDSFFTDYTFVVLETTEASRLRRDSKFRTSDNYIVAHSNARGLDIFDRKGKHIARVADATQINDYFIAGDEIICVPDAQPKLLAYNAKNGTLSREIPLPDSYRYARPLDANSMALSPLYAGSSKKNVDIYNIDKQKILERYFPYDTISTQVLDEFNPFVGQDAQSLFGVLPFDNTLYRITSDDCEPLFRYEFDTPDQIEPVDLKSVNLTTLSARYQDKRVVRWLGKYYKTPSGVHYQHFSLLGDRGVMPHLCKFNDNTHEAQTIRIGTESYPQFPYLGNEPIEIRDGYYVTAVESFDLRYVEMVRQMSFTFIDLGLQSGDNPVIFFYKLKE